MANPTTQQIAELLIGIARAQQAVIDAIESQKAGYKQTHLGPVLTTAAKIRNTGHAPTLMDFPSRVLLAHQGRNPPDLAQIVRDLEALLSGQTAAPAAAPGAAAPGPAADASSLDMT
ncbi:MAG: hypothetical protein HYY78_18095 [Betaproteobacteria bacterium]|nr:hypothetical protein [Betaproteobacteria bacterium]